MNKFGYTMMALFIVLSVSCEKEIKYKGKSEDSLLVVNGITEGDSTIKVKLSRSRFFLESVNQDFTITSNAVLQLTNQTSGQTYVVSTADAQGTYMFPVAAVQGNSYSIQITHPSYPVVHSQMSVPVAIPIQAVDTSSYVKNGTTYMKAQVKWNDPSGKDYYVMKLSYVYNGSPMSEEVADQLLGSLDPALDELSASGFDGEEYFTNQLFFTDELFDGSQKTLEIRFPNNAFPSPDLHYKFILFRCSEATYKYLISTEKSQNADGDFFSEPVKVFNNIENGYGIFSSLSRAVFVK